MAALLGSESTTFTLDNMRRLLCYTRGLPLIPGIVAQDNDDTVFLTNTQSGERRQTTLFHNMDAERGRSPGFVSVQAYAGNTRRAAVYSHQVIIGSDPPGPTGRLAGPRGVPPHASCGEEVKHNSSGGRDRR